jgi:hypothetical protein
MALGCIVTPIGVAMIFRPTMTQLTMAYAVWLSVIFIASGGAWMGALWAAVMFSSIVIPALTWTFKSLAR